MIAGTQVLHDRDEDNGILIGVGTGGATGPWLPHFSAKIILQTFPFFLKHNFYTETIHQNEESTNLRRTPS